MYATVLNQGPTAPGPTEDPEGHWVDKQDPDTGEITRVWTADDNPTEAGEQRRIIPCIVRGVIDGGIRVAGTTESYTPSGVYNSVDFVKMSFPANVKLNKRDRITNITNRQGEIIWLEEEFTSAPTVFDVMGVTPVVDPFGTHVENFALLQRAEVQNG